MMNLAREITGPVAVIGDLHGQVDKLGIVLDAIQDAPDFDRRWVVFAGDFVDRGPDTQACLDMVLDFMDYHPKTTAVAGNHDFAMAASLGIIPVPEYSNWAERWLDHYSSEATFAAYDVPFGDLEALKQAVPQAHQEFLAALPWVVEHPQYIIVHAGLDPNSPAEIQLSILRSKDYSLNRPQWLCEKQYAEADAPFDCAKTVISGHVWVPKVIFRRQRILCDTTGGMEGNLSAVLLPEMDVLHSGRRSVPVRPAQAVSHVPYQSEPPQKQWWKFW